MLGTKLQVICGTSGRRRLAWLLLAACLRAPPTAAQTADETFRTALAELREASFADKESIADRLIATGHAGTRPVLAALLEDRLFVRQSDQQIVIATSTEETVTAYDLIDPVSLKASGSAAPDQLSKVGTNNRLRRYLRTAIARFALASPDADVRLAAVKELLRSLDASGIELLRQRKDQESDSRVRYEIDTALALAALDGGDSAARVAAVETLSERLSLEVRNRLAAMLEKGADGSFAETDDAVRAAAARAVQSIDASRGLYTGIETLFFGLSLGSVLLLAAIGLAVTFGVMGVINMAHGEMLMLGAYSTYVVQQVMPNSVTASILVSIPVAFIVTALVGMLIQRYCIRY
ncbi:MAG TPA: hypothetical protein VFO58_02835, partial [Vicinamibacterales bacterium]|nr:hypothetical protein [Vicinamibacterales bacterium]